MTMATLPPLCGSLRFVVFAVICLFTKSAVEGSAIHLKSSSSDIKPLISSNLSITCGLHDTSPVSPVSPVGPAVGRRRREVTSHPVTLQQQRDSDVEDTEVTQTADNIPIVTSIIISRNGQDLATITEHFGVRVLGGGSNFQVSGQIPGLTGEVKGYLSLTWPHPSLSESGNYECVIDTLNDHGRNINFKQTVEVMEADVTVNDLVGHLVKAQLEKEHADAKLANLTQTVDDLAKKNENQSKLIANQAIALENQAKNMIDMNKTFSQQIENLVKSEALLKAENVALNKSLEDLKNHVMSNSGLPSVFFSVLLTTREEISPGELVIYDKVFVNLGSGYSNGIFTCPIGGYYRFDMHLYTYNHSDNSKIELQHNGNRVITAAAVGTNGERGTSNSVTLKLSKNDTVKVVGLDYDSDFDNDSDDLANTFSGQLIYLV